MPDDVYFVGITISVDAAKNAQFELGSTATLYEPYHGSTTHYEFGVLGKNKFPLTASTIIENIKTGYDNTIARDVTSTSVYQNISANNYWVGSTTNSYISNIGNGEITFSSSDGSYGAGMFVPVMPNQTYIISGNSEKVRFRVGYYNNDGTFSGQHFVANKAFTIPEEYHYAVIVIVPLADYYNQEITVSNIQLELGSSATTYEPYNPNKTVYGGWVDLVSGEVASEWILNTHTIAATDGTPGGAGTGGDTNYRFVAWNLPSAHLADSNKTKQAICDIVSNSNQVGGSRFWLGSNTVYMILPNDNNEYSATVAYAERDLNINTYQLPPYSSELKTFLSTNNVWSNADYVEVEYDLHETQTILARKQFIIANQPHVVKPAAAPLQNFVTDMAAPLKECKVYFSPVQDTSNGVPSPDNICPISGWTGCEMYKVEDNLFDKSSSVDDYRLSTGGANYAATGYYVSTYIPVNEGQVLIKNSPIADAYHRFCTYSSKGAAHFIRRVEDNTITIAAGESFVRICGEMAEKDTTMLYVDNPTTLPIDWTTEAGTIYGGYVDLVTGEVWETHHKLLLDGITSGCKCNSDYSNNTYIIGGIVYLVPTGGVDNGSAANSKLRFDRIGVTGSYEAITTIPTVQTITAGSQYLRFYVAYTADHPELDTKQKRIDFCNEFLSSNPITVVYPLRTPQLLTTLTPTQLKTLRGTNNIWSNANGNIELSYWKH